MRYILLFLLVALVTGCGGGALRAEAATADAVAQGLNPMLRELVERYRFEGNRIIDTAPDGPTAEKRLVEFQAKWKIVRKTMLVLRDTHDAWATSIESRRSAEAGHLALAALAAYCALIHALATAMPDWRPPVDLPVVRCQEDP